MARSHADNSRIREQPAAVPRRIADLAARQHGVATRRQLLALGASSSTLARWLVSGHLHRVHPGVYAVGHTFIGMDGHRMAAVLLGGAGSALSHWSSADLTGIIRIDERSVLHVSRRTTSGAHPPGIVLHRIAMLHPADLATHRGIPTTTAARTLFDLTPFLTATALGRAFEQAEYLQILDRSRLIDLCAGGRGHRNVGALRDLAAERYIPLDRVRSQLERLLLRICREHGIPFPAVNVPLLGYEVDFLWQREGLVIEADGGRHHGSRRDRDNERDTRLARSGYLVRRYSATALGRPGEVAAEVLEILSERRFS